MADTPIHARDHHPVFQGFDNWISGILGADMRLIYGMLAPILMVTGLIIVLALSPAKWLVGMIVVLEILALGLVVAGMLEMMRDDEEDQPPSP